MRGGDGAFPRGAWPRSDPFPEISFSNVALPVQYPGSAFHLQNLPGSWELLRETLYRGETRGGKGPRDFAHASGQEIYNPGSAPAKPSGAAELLCLQHLGGGF